MKINIDIKNKVEKILEDSKNIFSILNEFCEYNDNNNIPIEHSLLIKLAICCDTYNELLSNLEIKD